MYKVIAFVFFNLLSVTLHIRFLSWVQVNSFPKLIYVLKILLTDHQEKLFISVIIADSKLI